MTHERSGSRLRRPLADATGNAPKRTFRLAGAATHPIPERGAETGDAPARGRGDHLITRPHMKHVLPFPRAGTALTVAAAYIRIRRA